MSAKLVAIVGAIRSAATRGTCPPRAKRGNVIPAQAGTSLRCRNLEKSATRKFTVEGDEVPACAGMTLPLMETSGNHLGFRSTRSPQTQRGYGVPALWDREPTGRRRPSGPRMALKRVSEGRYPVSPRIGWHQSFETSELHAVQNHDNRDQLR